MFAKSQMRLSPSARAHRGCVRAPAAERSGGPAGLRGRRGNQLPAQAGTGCILPRKDGRPSSPNPAANLAGFEGLVIQRFRLSICPSGAGIWLHCGLGEDCLDEQRASTDLPPLPRLHDYRTGLVRGIQHLFVLRLRPRSHLRPSDRPAGRRRRTSAPTAPAALARQVAPLTTLRLRRPLARFTSVERACPTADGRVRFLGPPSREAESCRSW
jgi:hypothetical protein